MKPVVLLILDGWGYRAESADNAIALAELPAWNRLLAECPNTLIHTEGRFVGLPDGQMGNSEVGHMNIGAGRVVYQDLTRIDAAIEDDSFNQNAVLLAAITAAEAHDGCLHVFGLLSPGGVHSHEQHIFAFLRLAKAQGARRVRVHAFLDGRDTPPQSADARGENDEFVQATVLPDAEPMQDGDAVVFMNFRADRARQLTASFVDPDFQGFERVRVPALSAFVCLSEYGAGLPADVAYPPDTLRNTLADVLADNGKTQLRIAETEKYAHVTFFSNGGVERAVPGEQRILIPSPQVATYDLQPEMSCPELTEKLVEAIASGGFDAIICNIANPDMVGHSGSLPAAILAAEAVDKALAAVRSAVESVAGVLLVTADHGNVEMMRDPITGAPHTAHTVGPVYFVMAGRPGRLRSGGSLRDIAPTVLELLDLPKPTEMTGLSLIDVPA